MKKRKSVGYAIATLCLLLAFCMVVFTACGEDPEPEPSGETTLERIAVTKLPTKTEYTEGESFSRAGMVVTAYYSDGTSSTVLGYSVDKTGALTTADTSVTVTYKEKTDSFAIVVREKVIASHLQITSAETHAYKIEAEDCDLASEALGTPKETYIETHGNTQNNPNTSGGKSLGNLNYSGNRISLKIRSDVEATVSVGLCMAFNPSLDFDENVRTEWNGETIATGFHVAVGADAQYIWFDWKEYVIEDLHLNVGMNELALTVLNLSANYDYFNVTVNPVKAAETGIRVTTPPNKTVYTEGENFDPAGMTVTVDYDNGETAATENYTVDKTRLSAGDTSVTVTYKTFTATVPVTVNPRVATVSGLRVTTLPVKTAYSVGDYFRAAGMKVVAVYTDGTEDFVSDYTVDAADPLTADDTEVTLRYEDVTTTVAISVTEGEKAAHATVENRNYASYRVEAENAFLYKNRESDSYMVEGPSAGGFNPDTSGSASVGGLNFQTTGLQVLIDSDVEAVADVVLHLAYNPSVVFDDKTATYWNGEAVTTGFVVAKQAGAAYDWFDWHPYTIENVTLKEGRNVLELITLGDVSVNYDCFDIVVNPVRSVAVTQNPTKTAYVAGETFDPAGMIVTATFADGSSAAVTAYAVDTETPLSADDTAVSVVYGGQRAEIAVTVAPPAQIDDLSFTVAHAAA